MSLVIALSVGYGAVADIAAETTVSAVSSGSFVPLTPARVLDTRAGAKVGAADGSGAPLTLNVFNKGGLPAGGIGAVALNVTVTQSENPTIGDGFVTVYPCDQPRPDASNLNFVTDQTVPNSVIAPVSANGEVCFYVYGTTHLLADVSGYFPTGAGFNALTPSRIMNTRGGAKVGNAAGTGAPFVLKAAGAGGVPETGVAAVVLNVTVTQSENPTIGDGFVTVYPCDQPRPDASNLNFVTDQTVPNSVIAPVSANGEVCFYVYGTTHLLADVSGYFPAGTANRPPVFPDPVDVSYVTNFNYVYGFLVGIVTYLTLKTPCIDPDGDPLTYRWIPPNGTISSDYTSTDALWVRIWDRDFSTGNIRIYGGDLTIECSDPSGTVARHVKTF